MILREQLLVTADAYCLATGKSRARVSTQVLNNGSRLGAIAEGGDLGTMTFEAAMRWFSEKWPADTPWPDGVKRPVKNPAPIEETAT